MASARRGAVMVRLHEAGGRLLADVESKQRELATRRADLFDVTLTAMMGDLGQGPFLAVQPATGCLDVEIIAACCKIVEALLPFRRTGATAPAHWRGPLAHLRREIEKLLVMTSPGAAHAPGP